MYHALHLSMLWDVHADWRPCILQHWFGCGRSGTINICAVSTSMHAIRQLAVSSLTTLRIHQCVKSFTPHATCHAQAQRIVQENIKAWEPNKDPKIQVSGKLTLQYLLASLPQQRQTASCIVFCLVAIARLACCACSFLARAIPTRPYLCHA